MRNNQEGQSADPVANGSDSSILEISATTPASSSDQIPPEQASPDQETSPTPTSTPVDQVSPASSIPTTPENPPVNSAKTAVDLAAMAGPRESLSEEGRHIEDKKLVKKIDEEIKKNQHALKTAKDEETIKVIKSNIAKETDLKRNTEAAIKKYSSTTKRAKRQAWRKSHRPLWILSIIAFFILAAALITGTVFLIQQLIQSSSDSSYVSDTIEDRDELDDSTNFNYRESPAQSYYHARDILLKKAAENTIVNGVTDWDKYRSNMDKVVESQSDEYVKTIYRITESIVLSFRGNTDQAKDVLDSIDAGTLDEFQMNIYQRALFEYYKDTGNIEESNKYWDLLNQYGAEK